MAYNLDLPQISGLSEKDQILRMRDYLYRHVEQLNWILNDLEKGQSADTIFNAISGLIADSDDIFQAYYGKIAEKLGDFVIEAGTANGWTYKKWQRGTYEMFGTFEVTPTSLEKGESLYITNAIQIPTPFDINADAVVTGMGAGDYWPSGGAYANAGTISFKIISDKAISLTDASVVRLRVVGTYVTNTEE